MESKNPYQWHKQIWKKFNHYNEGSPFLFYCHNTTLHCRSFIKPSCYYMKISSSMFPLVTDFIVTANVVKTDSRTKKRSPVINVEAQKLWIENKIDNISDLKITSPRPLYFFKGKNSGVLHRVTFRGRGTITSEIFIKGIGHAKRFGLGMIILCNIC